MVAFRGDLTVKGKRYFLRMIKVLIFFTGMVVLQKYTFVKLLYMLKSVHAIAFEFYLDRTSQYCLLFYITPLFHLPHKILVFKYIYMYYFPY